MNQQKVVKVRMSWGNIQDQIASAIHAIAKGKIKKGERIVGIRFDYDGGHYYPDDKLFNIDVLVRDEVKVTRY